MKNLVLLSCLLSVCFIAAACASSDRQSDPDTTNDLPGDIAADPNPAVSDPVTDPVLMPQADLVNRTWTLTHYEYDDGIRLAVPSEQAGFFTVRLDSGTQPDGSNPQRIEGTIVCNRYSGAYVLEENVLQLSSLFATEAFCEELLVAPAPLFDRFLSTQSGVMVSLENDQLVLTTGANERLVFSTDQNTGFRQIYSGDLAFTEDLTFKEPLYQMLRSQEQLNRLYNDSLLPPCEDCNFEPLPMVDFSKAIVVFVAHEIVGSGGYNISVTNVVPAELGIQVEVLKTSPGNDCAVTTAFTGPYRLYQIDGVFDEVEFVERTAMYSC